MSQILNQWYMQGLSSPQTGDGFRPWIAAIILIVSVVVLVVLFLVSKNSDHKDDSYQNEDE